MARSFIIDQVSFPGLCVDALCHATGENTYLTTISKYVLCLSFLITMTIYTCPACGRDSNSHYFYQRHVGEKVILIIDPNGKLHHVVRNSCFGETQGKWTIHSTIHLPGSNFPSLIFSFFFLDFECIWKGCHYRDCDSEVIKDHINSACSHRGTLKNEFYWSSSISLESLL